MTPFSILAPVFVQVALTFILAVAMASSRLHAVRTRVVRPSEIALRQPAWPRRILQLSNCYHNQLESPLLFYAVVAFAMITAQTDLIFVVLSWLYVLARIIHAAIHVTTNHLLHRFVAFGASIVFLFALWAYFAVSLMAASL